MILKKNACKLKSMKITSNYEFGLSWQVICKWVRVPHSLTDPHGAPSDSSQERIKGIGALMECLGVISLHFKPYFLLAFGMILICFDFDVSFQDSISMASFHAISSYIAGFFG